MTWAFDTLTQVHASQADSRALFAGRTGRIGHKGVAVSFYTERDENIGPSLTKILLETNQYVPEYLKEYVPEGYSPENAAETLKFESDSDDEADGEDGEAGEEASGEKNDDDNADQNVSGW